MNGCECMLPCSFQFSAAVHMDGFWSKPIITNMQNLSEVLQRAPSPLPILSSSVREGRRQDGRQIPILSKNQGIRVFSSSKTFFLKGKGWEIQA